MASNLCLRRIYQFVRPLIPSMLHDLLPCVVDDNDVVDVVLCIGKLACNSRS